MNEYQYLKAAEYPVKNKRKPGTSKTKLWEALKKAGWMVPDEPDYAAAAVILKIPVGDVKLLFRYYLSTPNAIGPITIKTIQLRVIRRKTSLIDLDDYFKT